MISDNNLITAKTVSLSELLEEGKFSVPWHQRSYDWDEEHIDSLLADLAEAVNERRACHFLGSIMLIEKSDKNWEINDGQQRIITLSLICARLCKIFHERGYSKGESEMLHMLFDLYGKHNKSMEDSRSLAPRVIPPRNNKQNYNFMIRAGEVGENGKMKRAWEKIVLFFNDPAYKNNQWQEKFAHFILNKVCIIRLEVHKSLDSTAIFETINYRGKYLEDVNLIKNYIFSFFTDETKEAERDTVNRYLEKTYHVHFSEIKEVSDYIRCHLQATYGFLSKQKFYPSIKKLFPRQKTKTNDIYSLVERLANDNRIVVYETISRLSTNGDFLKKLTTHAGKGNNIRKIDDFLSELHDYTITQPIIFALFCRYSESSGEKREAKFAHDCTRLLASFVQRISQLKGNFRPSEYEENFANLAQKILTGSCNSADEFLNFLKEQYEDDFIFNDARCVKEMSSVLYDGRSTSKPKLVLKRIIEIQQRDIKISDSQVSIEHILPKGKIYHSASYWETNFNGSDGCNMFKNRLGNLTLLDKNQNSPKEPDNENFKTKKEIYKKSSYKLTRDICEYNVWNSATIEERQRKLAQIAIKEIWNFKI